MVLFNYSTKEITAKIVYYGPGLCGKTTNLQFIYDNLPATINKGKMLSLATKTDRTLFFDFLPIDLGTIRGLRTRLQLYTVPGQVFYNTTRKLVLKGADGVVFVADSQKRMADANLESFRNLEENLAEHGMKLAEMPLILQFNKRDLPDVLTLDEMNSALNRFNAPIYEAVATTGIGVHETLRAATRLVLNSLKERYAEKREDRVEPSVQAAVLAAAQQKRAARTPTPVITAPASAPAPAASAPAAMPSPTPVSAAPSHAAAASQAMAQVSEAAGGFSWDDQPAARGAAAAEWPEPAGRTDPWGEHDSPFNLDEPDDAGPISAREPLSPEPETPVLDPFGDESPVFDPGGDAAEAAPTLEPAAGEAPVLELAEEEPLTLELAEEETPALDLGDTFDLSAVPQELEKVPAPVIPVAEESADAPIDLGLEPIEDEEPAPIPVSASDEGPFAAAPEEAAALLEPLEDAPAADVTGSSFAAEPADDWMSRTLKAEPMDDLLAHASLSDITDDAAEAAPLDLVLDDPHDDMLGVEPAMDLISRSHAEPALAAPVAPVQAAAAAGAKAQEILVPIQLAIGDKSIRFDLRISLDLSAAVATASQEEPRR